MKKNLLFVFSIAVFGLLFANFTFAQDDQTVSAAGETYVISAKAGGVNYVEGKVSIARTSGTSGLLLTKDKIEIGDKISTGADGKTEILLNPGSFVRLGGNSEFEFVTTDLDNLKLKLSAGSAIFEVYAADEFKVSLDLPNADLELIRSGVYRVDVMPDGGGKISVWKGKVYLGDDKAEVKAGRSAIISGKTLAIAKFDRDNKDALDIWSQLRGKEAAKINARLKRDALSNSLLNSYGRGGWNMFNTFGLWVFDPFTRRWLFLPFGSGWSSPYGYGYDYDIWRCNLPRDIINPPPPPVTPTPTNNGAMTAEQIRIREERRQSAQTPTFQRFETSQRNETRGGGTTQSDNGNTQSDSGGWNNSRRRDDSNDSRTKSDSNDSRPTYTPSQPTYTPAPSPPIIVQPTQTDTKSDTKPVKDN